MVNVYAPGYLWSSFTVSPLSPTPLYILNDLTISGVVTWDNSTPYAFSDVTLYWGNPATTYYFIANVTTDGTGYFTYTFQVPAGTTTGNRYVWAYIPHLFHTPFYVYQYATSYSASLKIYDNVKNNQPEAMKNYLGLLKSGGSDYPVNQAAKAGADLTDKQTFMAVIKRFESLIDQLEKVLEEK